MLKSIEMDGQKLTYIEGENKNTVAGLIVKDLTHVNSFTGFYENLFEYALENNVDEVVILSYTTTGMKSITGLFMIKDNKMLKMNATQEDDFVKHLKLYLERKEVDYDEINSLEYIKTNGNEFKEYKEFIIDYYSPKQIDDTGLHVGNEMIQYGDKLTLNNASEFILDVLDEDSDLSKLNKNIPLDKLEIRMYNDGPGVFNSVGSANAISKKGIAVSNIQDYYYTYYEGPEETFEAFQADHQIKLIHEIANKLNEVWSPEMSEDDFNRRLKRRLESLERTKEDINSPVPVIVTKDLLLTMIEYGDLSKEEFK